MEDCSGSSLQLGPNSDLVSGEGKSSDFPTLLRVVVLQRIVPVQFKYLFIL